MNIFNSWLQSMRFGADVQSVMTTRMLMLAGGGPKTAAETQRMISEKMLAFGESQMAFAAALALGQGFHKATRRAHTPYRRAVRANRRRLGC
ncbi:MAG: hypothetical protein QOD40_1628 [Alphaproteobacteria bacterium]|jgi:hypothetical protein|nr:hypothetical protein [Alphaproteobacteria bacterium]MEA2992708.1 hypothetical protein [Alphaproteobacteria bacterium]